MVKYCHNSNKNFSKEKRKKIKRLKIKTEKYTKPNKTMKKKLSIIIKEPLRI